MKLTDSQIKALICLPCTPESAGVPYTTFVALERRGLIRVETTFDALAFPRKAMAKLTPAGRRALGEQTCKTS